LKIQDGDVGVEEEFFGDDALEDLDMESDQTNVADDVNGGIPEVFSIEEDEIGLPEYDGTDEPLSNIPVEKVGDATVFTVQDEDGRERRAVYNEHGIHVAEQPNKLVRMDDEEFQGKYRKPDGTNITPNDLRTLRGGPVPANQRQGKESALSGSETALTSLMSSPFRAAMAMWNGAKEVQAEKQMKGLIDRYNKTTLEHSMDGIGVAKTAVRDRMDQFDSLELADQFKQASPEEAKDLARAIYAKNTDELSAGEAAYKDYAHDLQEDLLAYNEAVHKNLLAREAAGMKSEPLQKQEEDFAAELADWEHADKVVDENERTLKDVIKELVEKLLRMVKRIFGLSSNPEQQQEAGAGPQM
jgi:hypothetical protein